MALIDNLEKMLAAGQDGALLRYGLGGECHKLQRYADAAQHLRKAVELDPGYSAAWKLLGKALTEAGETADAMQAYRQGIEVAEKKGDKQAAKEMQVFLKRLEKNC
jgi:Flp pilus assembly protein TadD